MNIVEGGHWRRRHAAPGPRINTGPFGPALVRFYETVRTAEVKIAEIPDNSGREAKKKKIFFFFFFFFFFH